MDTGLLIETAGRLVTLLTVMVFGCLTVLLALAGLLVFLLVKYQRQATFPMELLLQQDLPGEERARGVIANAIAGGRVPGSTPGPQRGAGEPEPDAGERDRLMTTSQGMAEQRGEVNMGGFDPTQNILT